MGSHLNLNQLRYFFEVARASNMKRAAGRMGVSQPALSKQVQALEESLGFMLFFRSSRGMRLTPNGEVIYAYCERVFGHIHELEERIDGLKTGSAGQVAIGSVNSIAIHFLPDYLRLFRDAHQGVKLRLITSRYNEVIRALRDHRVDIGLVAGVPEGEEFTARTFKRNPLRVVTSPDHPLALRAREEQPLPASALDDEPMVTFDELAPTGRLTAAELQRLGVEPKTVAESSDIEVLKRLVEIGVGFAVLPTHSITHRLERGRIVAIDVEGFALSRDLLVIYRSEQTLPPAAKHFVELLCDGEAAADE